MKSNAKKEAFTSVENLVLSKIYMVRGMRVMLDADLSEMYGVETRRLNEQVKRNRERFPNDFMFQLKTKELAILKSEYPSNSWGGRRTLPYVFTEHGVLMLSSVLNSKTAIRVNIKIMRVYNKLKTLLSSHKDILNKLEQLEQKFMGSNYRLNEQEQHIRTIFEALQKLIQPPNPKRKRIGFRRD